MTPSKLYGHQHILKEITAFDLFTKSEPTAIFIEVEDVETRLHTYAKLWEPPYYKEAK